MLSTINKQGKIAYPTEFSLGPAGPKLRGKADCWRPSAAYEERNKESREVKLLFSVTRKNTIGLANRVKRLSSVRFGEAMHGLP